MSTRKRNKRPRRKDNGAKVTDTPPLTPEERASKEREEHLSELVKRRTKLETKSEKQRIHVNVYFTLAIIAPLAAAGFAWLIWFYSNRRIDDLVPFVPLLVFYAIAPLALIPLARARLKHTEETMQDIDFETDLLKFAATPQETRAEKIVRISNTQLRRYYDLNLGQNVWIFGLGVFCILVGVVVIGATFALLLNVAKTPEEKYTVGVLGAIGSLFVNYVAAVYLKMHAEATASLSAFHARLVETHQMLLANLLASRIGDDNKRWDTIAQLSISVGKKST